MTLRENVHCSSYGVDTLKLPEMVSIGDRLLFAVSARRRLSWRSFADILDAVFVPDDGVGTDTKQVRSTVASLGSSLGHWDVIPDASTAWICIASPSFARLPWPGLPRAVLCGARSPDTLAEVYRAARAEGAMVQTSPQAHMNPYAPTRIEVAAESTEGLSRVAAALSLRWEPAPAAETLALVSGSVAGYVASLTWSSEPDIDWTRRDFDPDQLRLVRATGSAQRSSQLTLSAYENPAGWARQDRLWRGERSALADRDWGRFAVLAELGRFITAYQHRDGTFTVPRQVPLPAIPARALALCSGKPPRAETGQGLGIHTYLDVPAGIATTVLQKLGQDGSTFSPTTVGVSHD